jgi:hypothetical protein
MQVFDQYEEMDVITIKGRLIDQLSSKLDKFPTDLMALLRDNAILTGGASASMFHNEVVNDYDLYLTDSMAIKTFESMLKLSDINSLIEDVNPKYRDVTVSGKLITAKATTFKNKIQVITMTTADARKSFDYIHCMPYLSLSTKKYHISKQQYNSIKNKKLVINPNAERVDGHRTTKFIDRGWKP